MDSSCLLKETHQHKHVRRSKMDSADPWKVPEASLTAIAISNHSFSFLMDAHLVSELRALVLGNLPEWIIPNGYNDNNPQTWHSPPEIKPQYFKPQPLARRVANMAQFYSLLENKMAFLFEQAYLWFWTKEKGSSITKVVVLVTCLFYFMSRVTFSLATTLSTKNKYRTFRRKSELSVFIYFSELFSVLEEFPFLIRFWALLVTVSLLAASIAFYVVFHME